MIQAHCEGILDLRDSDMRDPKWWHRLQFTLEYLSRRNHIKIHEYALQFNLAVLSYQDEPEVLKEHWNRAENLRGKLVSELMPWIATDVDDMQDIAKKLRQQYIENLGDPADPAYQAEMQRLMDHWRSRNNARS